MKVCVVGAGTMFLSGISYYTSRLANALAERYGVSAIVMRRLLPAFLYPGRKRVGKDLTSLEYVPGIKVYDGVDWFWARSMLRALTMLNRERPDIVIFQWWSGTVLHSYLMLALIARLRGAQVVIEFHEVLDTAELKLWPVRLYVQLAAPLLMSMASGFVVHSEFDKAILERRYKLGNRPAQLIHIGPFDHHRSRNEQVFREAPPDICNLLFFGVIRPFKGLEDLIEAFNQIPETEIGRYWLTVVGETWEGWTLPTELIEDSRYRDRMTFVNRYVSDDEVAAVFAGADAVVLPYHRSSASGPLHTAMSHGLPVVVTSVGGLIEASRGYEGAVMVPPKNPAAILDGIRQVSALKGCSFADPHSWETNTSKYTELFATLSRRDS